MMSKYIIEIEDNSMLYHDHEDEKLCVPVSVGVEKLGIHSGYKLTPYNESAAEQRCAEKAWELAKKIIMPKDNGGFSGDELVEIFGEKWPSGVFKNYPTYQEAAAKFEAWREQKGKDFKVGDEVSDCTGTGVVVEISAGCLRIMYSNGATYLMNNKEFKKTGRHFPEVAELLKKIGESDE